MIIYKTLNLINNKIYIGKDKHNDPNYIGSGRLLRAAVKKYGAQNFRKDILEYCDDNDMLNRQERYWIAYYNSTDKSIGYNMTDGGEGGNTRTTYSYEQLVYYYQALSDGVKNSNKYKEHVQNMRGKKRPEHSEKMKQLYASGKLIPHNVGKITSSETRRKISNANKGRSLTETQKYKIAESKFKPIDQFDLNGNFICTYDSIKHAAAVTNTNRDSIYGCCVGKYKTGGGYKWAYHIKNSEIK